MRLATTLGSVALNKLLTIKQSFLLTIQSIAKASHMSALQIESQTYQAQLPKMLSAHDGEYVVIKGSTLAHFSESYEQALNWAYDAYGLDTFFVKKVTPDQDVAHFTHNLG